MASRRMRKWYLNIVRSSYSEFSSLLEIAELMCSGGQDRGSHPFDKLIWTSDPISCLTAFHYLRILGRKSLFWMHLTRFNGYACWFFLIRPLHWHRGRNVTSWLFSAGFDSLMWLKMFILEWVHNSSFWRIHQKNNERWGFFSR